MKALAYRLRGRRNSQREDGHDDDVVHTVCYEMAIKDECSSKRSRVEEKAAMDENWRKKRESHNVTRSCKVLGALTAQSCADVVPQSSAKSINSLPLSEQRKDKSQRKTASAPVMTWSESSQQEKQLTRAHSTLNVDVNGDAIVTLRSKSDPTDDRRTCMASSLISSHDQSSSTERSRFRTSISSNATLISASSQKPEVAVDVRYSGILITKRGILKVACKRYYFVARSTPELYSCKDETSFRLWLASGHPLEGGDAVTKASGLIPVLVGTVLRADTAPQEGGSNGGYDLGKTLQVMIGSASKCSTLQFAAESGQQGRQWLKALQEVQLTKRDGNEHSSKLSYAADTRLLLPLDEHNALCKADTVLTSDKSMGDEGATGMESKSGGRAIDEIGGHDRGSVVMRSSLHPKLHCFYTGDKLQNTPESADDDDALAVLTATSYTTCSPTSPASDHENRSTCTTLTTSTTSTQSLSLSRCHGTDAVKPCSLTAFEQTQGSPNGNVLLFVPVAGSSLTASASRMDEAQRELDALIIQGAKAPSRVMQDYANGEPVAWRYGVPDYVLTDLTYVKGRMREPDTTPLASYVEECCQTFIMEATHKARYDQWCSVYHDTFYLQVNDGVRVRGRSILENDMLGLLYLGDVREVCGRAGHTESKESQDPRAELAEAFPDGFPMEVLDVFTQPPQCYFSWRHWGLFTGKYRGVKGDGSMVEIRGFCEMTVDASRIRSLRLFFKQKDLLFGLQQAIDRVTRIRRESSTASFLSSRGASSRQSTRIASAAVELVKQNGSLPNLKTSEIIEGLANFTIKAKEDHLQQIR